MTYLDNLKQQKRWVNYNLVKGKEGFTKIPINCQTGRGASSTDPNQWFTYNECMENVKNGKAHGVGIILNGDGLICIDLDHSVNEGRINPEALKIVTKLNSYTEKSVSGNGLHIFITAKNFHHERTRSSKSKIPIEIYSNKRFIVFTENRINNNDIIDKSLVLENIYNDYLENDEFIARVNSSKYREKFNKLFNGDMSEFNNDHSAADLSLMSIIGKFTDDPFKMDEVFRKSKLNRPKYEEREDYRQGLIKLSLQGKTKQKEEKSSNFLTDYTVCQLIKAKYDNRIVYDSDQKVYLYFNGKYYKKDNNYIIIKALTCVINDFVAECDWSEKEKEILQKKYLSNIGAKGVEEYYKTLPGVTVEHKSFNKEKYLICVKNGIVDLRTGEILPHNSEILINNYIDINYEKIDWDKFLPSRFYTYLDTVTESDNDLINYLEILAGYCLSGETAEQSFYYLIGQASTGKSIFIELLKYICGSYAKTVPINCFDIKSNDFQMNMASVSDARLIISSEENACTKMNTSLVKQITGEDTITARYLYAMPFEYKPKFKILISTNEAPQMNSDVASMKRRLKPIPFNHVISKEKRDRNLLNKLKEEKEIILSWAVYGAMAYYDRLKNMGTGFEEHPKIEEEINNIFEEQDIFSYWVAECYDRDESAFIPTQELFDDYISYCHNHEMSNSFKNINCFSKWLTQKDYVRKGRNRTERGYFGLKKKQLY